MKHIIFMLISLVVLSYSALAEEYTVSKITDGDTIHVIAEDSTEIVVRFDYIDTMESYKNNRAKSIAKICKVRIKELITSGLEEALAKAVCPTDTLDTDYKTFLKNRNTLLIQKAESLYK